MWTITWIIFVRMYITYKKKCNFVSKELYTKAKCHIYKRSFTIFLTCYFAVHNNNIRLSTLGNKNTNWQELTPTYYKYWKMAPKSVRFHYRNHIPCWGSFNPISWSWKLRNIVWLQLIQFVRNPNELSFCGRDWIISRN